MARDSDLPNASLVSGIGLSFDDMSLSGFDLKN